MAQFLTRRRRFHKASRTSAGVRPSIRAHIASPTKDILRLESADGGHHLQHRFFGCSSMQMVSPGAKCHHARPVDPWHRRFHRRRRTGERCGSADFNVIGQKGKADAASRSTLPLSEDRSDEPQIAEAGRPALKPAQARRA
jgi:hypothetical protein